MTGAKYVTFAFVNRRAAEFEELRSQMAPPRDLEMLRVKIQEVRRARARRRRRRRGGGDLRFANRNWKCHTRRRLTRCRRRCARGHGQLHPPS